MQTKLDLDTVRQCVVAIVTQDQSILLGYRSSQRSFYPDVWDLFGGHVEVGETLEEALVRELGEELGIVPTHWMYIETLKEPNPGEHGPGLYHFYLVTGWTGAPANLLLHEHAEICWFGLEEAMRLTLAHPEYRRLFALLSDRSS